MSFVAKDKETGQLILVAAEFNETGAFRDAHPPVRPNSVYGGNFLDAYPGNSPWVEFTSAEWGVIDGDLIEEFHAELRLVKVQPKSTPE